MARVFLKLGIIGFGGPAAHIAMMRSEVVIRRGWVDDAEFAELVGATNLIPGPNSTELAIHLGARRAGWRGLLVGGTCFIAPAVVIVSVLAALYERYGTQPAAYDIRYGILPVVIAIVAWALVGLARTSPRSPVELLCAAAAFVGFRVHVHELLVLAPAAAVGAAAGAAKAWRPPVIRRPLAIAIPLVVGTARTSLVRLFTVFVEIGAVLYGSGYVLLAFLQRNLVDDLGWITSSQLLDSITVGQITPGPVFTTATFIGWQVHGVAGAAVATLGIFAPSFAFVAALGPIVAWTRRHDAARRALRAVTAASLGLMAGVLAELASTGVVDVLTAVVALVAFAVLALRPVNSAWLVAAGLAVGVCHALVS